MVKPVENTVNNVSGLAGGGVSQLGLTGQKAGHLCDRTDLPTVTL
jgi:hypothetical protein